MAPSGTVPLDTARRPLAHVTGLPPERHRTASFAGLELGRLLQQTRN
ncbi:hypothetical protein AB0B15_27200 [Streptomyces sp. NPDC045456]